MECQYFNGIRFTRTNKNDYFSNSTIHKSMHRYVWEFYNGDIPDNYEIHHIDEDKANNNISNLQCVSSSEHHEIHRRTLSQEDRKWRRENMLTKAIPKAAEWHKSDAGLRWHKEQAKTRNNEKKSYTNICQLCGIEFVSKHLPKKFCSGKCAQKYRRLNGLNNIDAICEVCGKTFITDKYRPHRTCGKSCGNKLAWKEGKAGKGGCHKGDNWRLNKKGN